MTMRLDIVTNDAGELVRREHARDLGASVVVAVYRLAKLAQLHDLTNQAFTRQLEQTHQMIGEYGLRSGANVNVLFAHKAIFVAGQLLKGSRSTYEMAIELGEILERLGGQELSIQRDISRDELLAFAEQISHNYRSVASKFKSPTPKLRVRAVNEAARLRGFEIEDLSADQRVVRTYASAVVIMRRFFEDLAASRYVLPRRIKRIAQSLVDLSYGSTPSFLGVTEVRNANFDEAGRAVNTAILAVSMAREITQDRSTLSQIAMAAMMHDVARPRAQAQTPSIPGMTGPTMLSEDQEDRLAAGAAAVLTAVGRVNEPSIARMVLAFEALWLRRKRWLGPLYWGARGPIIHATILCVARRYNDLLTPEPGLPPNTPDYAVAVLAEELKEADERVVLRMLVSALGLLPKGTVVQLNTGEVAEVVRGPRGPLERARVRLLTDASGGAIAHTEIELSGDRQRSVARVVSVEGWRKGIEEVQRARLPSAPPDSEPRPAAASSAPTRPSEKPSRESVASFSSEVTDAPVGSSPSAVAEAMGKAMEPPRTTSVADMVIPGARGAIAEPLEEVAGLSSEPSARGNLGTTPLPHVLVYMLDHALTGSVVFEGETGSDDPGKSLTNDAIYFVRGVPVKVRLSDGVARLGEVLVKSKVLDASALDPALQGARKLGLLLGEYLVGNGILPRGALTRALEAQLLERVAYIANLPPEVTYSYYKDVDLLEGFGAADRISRSALSPVLSCVRHWADRARVRATLNRVSKHSLAIHEDADLEHLALLPAEKPVLEALRAGTLTLKELYDRELADEDEVSSLVYALAVTRQFALKGQKKGPMAARQTVSSTTLKVVSKSAPPEVDPSAPTPPTGAPTLAPAVAAPPPTPVALTETAAPAPAAAPPPYVPRQSASKLPALRPIAPAAMPSSAGVPSRGAPQIRPIARRTMVGLQAAVPPSTRGKDIPSASTPEATPRVSQAPAGVPAPNAIDADAPITPRTGAKPRAGKIESDDMNVSGAEAALEAMTSFRLAEAALQRGDIDGARRLAGKAVASDPSQADYVALLAWIRSMSGETEAIAGAVTAMSRILKNDASHERALLYRARLYVRTNRVKEAVADFNALLAVSPHHREAATELRVLKSRIV